MSSREFIQRTHTACQWAMLVTIAWIVILPATASGWSECTHTRLSQAALEVQPQALRNLWSKPYQLPGDKKGPRPISEYLTSYEFWTGSPDYAENKGPHDEFLYYEDGWVYHYFSFSPAENRLRAQRGAQWYFEHIIKSFREGRAADAARYAGGFAHPLEDRSSPVHAWDGYKQERESLETKYADRGLQDNDKSFRGDAKSFSAVWFVDNNDVKVDIKGYKPKLLGVTPEEAAVEVARRMQVMSDYTRKVCSEAPDVPGTFLNEHLKDKWYGGTSYFHGTSPATVAVLNQIAEKSALLVADMFYTGYQLSLAGAANVSDRPDGENHKQEMSHAW